MTAFDRQSGRMQPPQVLVAILIAAAAFIVRCLPIHDVFVRGRVLFIEADSYYHLRRILFAMRNFPETLGSDPYLGYPTVAKAIWPPLLDTALALSLLPFADPADPHRVETFLVWLPPLAGAATVFALFVLALRLFGFATATASSLILCFLSAHFWYSQISFVDHHAFISLLSTLLLVGGIGILAGARDPDRSPARLLAGGVALGALSAVTLLVWPGGILYVALIAGGLLVFAVDETAGHRRGGLFGVLIALHLTGLCVVLPFSFFNIWPQWSAFSPVVLSRFQPLFFLLGALHALIGLLFFRTEGAPRGFLPRAAAMLISAGALLLASILVFSELAPSLGDAVAWLGRTDSFQAMVGESRPLFNLHGVFNHHIAELRLSYFVYLLPFATLLMAWKARRRDDAKEVFLLAGWTLTLFVFTLLQKRFFNTSSVALALVFGWAVVALARWAAQRLAHRRGGRALGAAAAAFVALLLLWPTFAAYHAPIQAIRARLTGEPPIYDQRIRLHLARQNVAEWIRNETPPTSGLWDTESVPEYGVLARWGEGHFINYVAQRPALVGNFGDDLGGEHFLKVRGIYHASPEDAARTLDELQARYIVIRTLGEKRPLALWLAAGDGSGSGRYRLVYETPFATGRENPIYRVYEIVSGAKIVGKAPPGTRVDAQLAFETNLGRHADYRASAIADEGGVYRLHLAYASRGAPPAIRPGLAYELRAADQVARVVVDEDRLWTGESLPGPSF